MAEARHRVLANALRERIASGKIPIGSRLPTELELAERFSVSRATVRRALEDLEAERLVERRKRVGTTVIADRPDTRFRMVTDGLRGVLSLTRDTWLDIDEVRSVPESSLDWPDIPPSPTRHWLQITGTRTLDGDDTPFNGSSIWVTGRYAGIEPMIGPRVSSVFEVIEKTFGVAVTRIDQSCTAAPCPAELAGTLGLSPNAPVMCIDARLYDRKGEIIELSRAVFDPARFTLRTDVRVD